MNKLLIRNSIFNTDHVLWINWSASKNELTVKLTTTDVYFPNFQEFEWKELQRVLGFKDE